MNLIIFLWSSDPVKIFLWVRSRFMYGMSIVLYCRSKKSWPILYCLNFILKQRKNWTWYIKHLVNRRYADRNTAHLSRLDLLYPWKSRLRCPLWTKRIQKHYLKFEEKKYQLLTEWQPWLCRENWNMSEILTIPSGEQTTHSTVRSYSHSESD